MTPQAPVRLAKTHEKQQQSRRRWQIGGCVGYWFSFSWVAELTDRPTSASSAELSLQVWNLQPAVDSILGDHRDAAQWHRRLPAGRSGVSDGCRSNPRQVEHASQASC